MPTPALIDILRSRSSISFARAHRYLRSRSCGVSSHHARIATERHEREVVPVEVVAEVEVARESRAGEESLLPRPVRALSADQPGDPALDDIAPRPVGCQ